MKAIALTFTTLGVLIVGWLISLLLNPTAWSVFGEQGSLLMAMEWGRISLVDLYAGFILSLALVWFIEPKLWLKILISLTLPTLGNPVLAIWLLYRLNDLIAIMNNQKKRHKTN